MSIELRPLNIPGAKEGDLDEVVAPNASVHLETLSDNAIMLIVDDGHRHVYLNITHRGRSPMRVRVYEEWVK